MYAHVTANISGNTSGGGSGSNDSFSLAADGTRDITGELLAYIRVRPTGLTAALKIGTSPGGSELVDADPLAGLQTHVFAIGVKFDISPTTIYITGITSNTQFTFYKL